MPALLPLLVVLAAPGVLLTGDSLAVGTAPYLADQLPGRQVRTAAAVGRHADAGPGVLRSAGALPGVIAVSLGTNDDPRAVPAFRAAVRATLRVAGPRRCVVWATIRRPPVAGRSYAGLNRVLASEAGAHPTLRLVPWRRMADRHPEWRAPDGVHATPAGYRARARAYARAVRGCVSPAGR